MITYNQVKQNIIKRLKENSTNHYSDVDRMIESLEEGREGSVIKSILVGLVDSVNDSFNLNNEILCSNCGGKLIHTGEQKSCFPPIDIYKCSKCNETVEIRQ